MDIKVNESMQVVIICGLCSEEIKDPKSAKVGLTQSNDTWASRAVCVSCVENDDESDLHLSLSHFLVKAGGRRHVINSA